MVDFLDTRGAVTTAPFDENRWVRVDRGIAAAAARGLKVLLDLSTYRNLLQQHGLNPYNVDWRPFLEFMTRRRNTVTGRIYADDPTISMVVLAGEVDPPNSSTTCCGINTDSINAFFTRTARQFKALDRNHLLCPGGLFHIDWNSGIDYRTIFAIPEIDVAAVHDYDNGRQNSGPAAAYCQLIGKPWILEEFGRPQSMGDAARASYFQGIYDSARGFNAAGIGFWNLWTDIRPDTYDVNPSTPLTWEVVRRNAPPSPRL
jgi:endo-1,4-beta-mannosidase